MLRDNEKSSKLDYVLGKISRLEKQLDNIEQMICQLVNNDAMVKIEEKDGTEVLIRTSTGRINKKPTTKTKKAGTDNKQDRSLFDYCDHPF